MTIRDVAILLKVQEFTIRNRLERLELMAASRSAKLTSLRFAEPNAYGREVVSTQYKITQYGRDILAAGATAKQSPTPTVNSIFQLGAALNRDN